MSIKITLEFATAVEAAAALQALQSAAVNAEDDKYRSSLQAKREAVKAAQPKPAKAPKEEKPAEVVEPPQQAPAEAVEPPQQAPAVDYPTVQKAVLNLANSKGRDAALEVLAGFNVKSGKELKPEQYEAVLAALNVALEN